MPAVPDARCKIEGEMVVWKVPTLCQVQSKILREELRLYIKNGLPSEGRKEILMVIWAPTLFWLQQPSIQKSTSFNHPFTPKVGVMLANALPNHITALHANYLEMSVELQPIREPGRWVAPTRRRKIFIVG